MRLGKSIGFSIGKAIGRIGQKERKSYHKSIMAKQNKLDNDLWMGIKDKMRNFSDEQFEDIADYINEEVCTGERKYSDPRHEVYSRLKHDMVSYQYEKLLNRLK